jgi:hypothetical protein
MIRLNTAGAKGFMLALHVAAIPVGILIGKWVFDSLT